MKCCIKCNCEYDDNLNYCSKCGDELIVRPRGNICPSCGKSLDENIDIFCPYCGYLINQLRHTVTGGKAKNIKKHLYGCFMGRRGRMDAFVYGTVFGIINFVFMSFFVSSDSIILKTLTFPIIVLLTVLLISNIVKRVHDFNKSGFWLIGAWFIVCLVGGVITVIDNTIGTIYGFFAQWWIYFVKGTDGTNKYGDKPKSIIF